MFKTSYSYTLGAIGAYSTLRIVDENRGGRSVTNAIVEVIDDICEAEGWDPLYLIIVYRDSEGRWDGFIYGTGTFVPLGATNPQEAELRYQELIINPEIKRENARLLRSVPDRPLSPGLLSDIAKMGNVTLDEWATAQSIANASGIAVEDVARAIAKMRDTSQLVTASLAGLKKRGEELARAEDTLRREAYYRLKAFGAIHRMNTVGRVYIANGTPEYPYEHRTAPPHLLQALQEALNAAPSCKYCGQRYAQTIDGACFECKRISPEGRAAIARAKDITPEAFDEFRRVAHTDEGNE